MHRNQQKISAGGMWVLLLVLLNAIVLQQGFIAGNDWYKIAYATLPLLLVAIIVFKRKIF